MPHARERFVMRQVLLRHSRCAEPLLKAAAHQAAIEFADAPDGLAFIFHDKAGDVVIDNLRHRPGAERDHD